MKAIIVKDVKEVFRNRYMLLTVIIAPILGGIFGAAIMWAVIAASPEEAASDNTNNEVMINAPVVPGSPKLTELFKDVAVIYPSVDEALASNGFAVVVEETGGV